MNDSIRTRLVAAVLAFLTVAAVVFGVLNYRQRSQFAMPDDGVTWLDTSSGVQAWRVEANSPAVRAGIHAGDTVQSVNGVHIERAPQVTQQLWRAGVWSRVEYRLTRNGIAFEANLVTAPAERPSLIWNSFGILSLLYLFIGLFIFIRRWSAPRAIHFYLFCLVSFIFYAFHYSGKLNSFDWTIYWSNVAALLLQAALLVHFALVFPQRRVRNLKLWLAGVYAVPLAFLALHVSVASGTLDLMPSIESRFFLDQAEFAYWAAYFLVAAFIFLDSYRRAPSGLVRQQLKWVTFGTFAGVVPFLACYIVPFLMGIVPSGWMTASAFSLVLIPLCFGYAIIRYRLMDVDIIFKRGLAYTLATAAVVAVYFAVVAMIGLLFHSTGSVGTVGTLIAIVVAAILFQPVRDWMQARLDHFFYRDRLNYRRTLIEFGRTLTNEVRIDPLLGSVLDRISQTLLVDRLAIFLEDPAKPGTFLFSRSLGFHAESRLDLSFLNLAERPALAQTCLFFESARSSSESESVRRTLEILGLNYFISCRFRDRIVAVLGLGKTVDGDYLSSDDIELLDTIGSYVAIAIENAQLYNSLEQKATQIERLKEFHENIIESLYIGVLTVDLEDRIESWNPQMERMLGISRNEAVTHTLDEILPADLVAEMASRSSDERVASIYKFRLYNRDGRRYVVNASFAPLIGKNGERLGRLILLDDITQRVRLEEQMVQNEKLTSLGLLAAGVAHEVNTPLAVISNYTQMLAKQIPAEDLRQKTIDKIVKQTFRASEIVNNLLNFSRTGGAEFVEVSLNTIIDETLTLVQHPFKTARVNVIRNFGEQLPLVLGSTTRLQQVFLNLFMNARDAMPDGGMLEVRTFAQNGSVEVEVTDTGIGIRPEHLHRVFDPFFTTKSSGRGTGLGLSVSYGIIKEHAGKLEVRSTPEKGTSFRLEFPVAKRAVHA
ncbi:MAG TPA: ATP-binding protein [Candidatus Acidoferrales bacterium]|nr:ATP-binding protein [Candidatus Acidoferrales bacterium]